MKRQGRPKDAASISLFPFLAVLICTMGALILLLVAIARQSKIQADREAEIAAQSRGATDVERARDLLYARMDFMREENGRTQEQLAVKRASLAQVEAALRQLKDRLQALDASKSELDRLASSGTGLSQAQRDELLRLKTKVAETRGKLETARRQAAEGGESYCIVPYDGPNATRRRPLYIECRADGIYLQPEGLCLTETDFEGPLGPGNPLAAGLRAACDHLDKHRLDGRADAGEPYPLLLVRPDGVESYLIARQALKSWGSDFGYELIEQDWKVDFKAPDPQLLAIEARAVEEARSRQQQLAALLGNRGGGGAGGPYRGGGGGTGGNGGPWRPNDDNDEPTTFALAPGGGGLVPLRSGSRSGSGGRRPGGGSREGLAGNAPRSGGSPAAGANGTNAGQGGGSVPQLGRDFEFENYGPDLPGSAGNAIAGSPDSGQLAGAGSANAPGSAGGQTGVGDGGQGRPGGEARGMAGGGTTGAGQADASGGTGGQPGSGQQGSAGGSPSLLAGGQPAAMSFGQTSPPSNGAASGATGQSGGQAQAGGTGQGRVGLKRPAGVGSAVASDQAQQGPNILPQQLYGQRAAKEDLSPQAGSVAESMGKNWALPEAAPKSFPVTRPIRLELRNESLTLLPEPGSGKSPRVIKLAPRTRDSVDPLVSAIWDHMDAWGIAGKGLYWRPTLNIEVTPEATQRMTELRTLLADSGLTVNERPATPRKPLNASRTAKLAPR